MLKYLNGKVNTPNFGKKLLMIFLMISLSSCKNSAPTDAPVITTKITGVITNKATGVTVTGVQLTTTPTTSTITTDSNGKYDFDNIPAGSYVITAIKSGFINTQINVNVTEGSTAKADIQIEELSAQLEVSQTFVDFSTANNQASITINNKSGIGTINFSLSKNAGWLTLSESAGSITTNVKNITLTVDRNQVAYGTFNDVITITSNVGTAIVNVQMVKQNPNAPQLTVTPILLDYGTAQNELGVTLSNTGTGGISWNASTQDGWITISPSSGTLSNGSTTARIKVNRTGLPPNYLNSTVVFSSNGGNQTVGVKMTIPSSPILSVNPNSLDFGETENSKAFQITNNGTGSLNWNIISNQAWLTVNQSAGTNSSLITVTVNKTGMTKGTYSGVLSVGSNGGNEQITVTMKVPPPTPPAPVTLGQPSDVTYNSCKIAWSQSGASDFASYVIYKDTNPDVTENSTLVNTITNVNTTNYQITGLTGSTKYYFRIYVVNAKGSSAGSNIVSAVTERKLGTWSVAISLAGINPNANCLFPVSETDVWAVGDEIWHYNGSSWLKDLKPSGIGKLNAIFFSSATDGWAVGENGTVIRYNGGSWAKVTSPSFTTSPYLDVVANGNSDVWISGYKVLYHYDGNGWTNSSINGSYFYDMDLLSGSEIWACANGIWKYNGAGWANIAGTGLLFGRSISVVNKNEVWVTEDGSSGTSIYRYDGNSFLEDTTVYNNNYTTISAINMISSLDGWVGNNSFYHYNGKSWKMFTNPASGSINCIRMTSSKTGWAVSSKGEILRYKE